MTITVMKTRFKKQELGIIQYRDHKMFKSQHFCHEIFNNLQKQDVETDHLENLLSIKQC